MARPIGSGVVFACAVLLSGASAAQDPGPIPNPNLAVWAAGEVNAILPLPDGSVIVGGRFESVFDPVSQLDVPRAGLARFLPSGALDLAWSPSISSQNRIVYDLERDDSNRIYVAGQFNAVDGFSRQNVARLTAEGALDQTWSPDISAAVVELAIDETGALYVGGFFTSVDGVTRNSIARFVAQTVALDSSWNPDIRGSPFSGGVFAIVPRPGGDIYVGGGFDSVGGATRNGLAKIQRSGIGAVDSAWNPSSETGALVYDLQLVADGRLMVGGSFFQIGGLARSAIARLSADGAGDADPVWSSSLSGGFVEDLHADANGDVYVAGFLGRQATGFGEFENLAKLSQNGTIDPAWNASADRPTRSIARDAAGRVLVGGPFGSTSGGSALGLARLSATDGSVAVAHFVQDQPWIRTVAAADDGSVIVGGRFARAAGQPRLNLLKLDAAGVLDSSWRVDTNEDVFVAAVDDQDRVIVGGRFTRAAGQVRNRVFRAAVAGAGAVDPDWDPNADNDVYSIASAPDGSVYLGGFFLFLGNEPRLGIGKVSGSGSGAVDTLWSAATPSQNVSAYALAVDGDGSVFVGGSFSTIGGATRNSLAKLSGTTGAALAWDPAASGGTFGPIIHGLVLDGQGSIHVAGEFTAIGGRNLIGLAKLPVSGNGSADPAWTTSSTAPVLAIASSPTGDLYVAGVSMIDGLGLTRRLARLPGSLGGTLDEDWNPAPDGVPSALVVRSDGNVVIAGNFRTVGTSPRQAIAAVPPRVDQVFLNGFE